MKRLFTLFTVVLWFTGTILPVENARLMRYPAISKDKIVFTYENDLWICSVQGGLASRLTTFPGDEFSARFSPDGKTIAFAAEYDGSMQTYTIPVEGGSPKRITYVPGDAQPIAWAPDGKRIVFRSYYENTITRTPKLYFTAKDGSAPEVLPIDRGTLCSFSADGKKMLYVRKGNEEYNWKRYKGGEHTDIWMYDFSGNQFTPLSNYSGKNTYPMWLGNMMYFVSDKSNGVANFYAMDLNTKEISQITNFSDVDVMRPETDGTNIVFLHDGYIKLLDLKTKKVSVLQINIPTDEWALRSKVVNPKDYIQSFNIANNGKTVALDARGDIHTVGTNEGDAVNLSNSSAYRERFPQLSPDGKTVAFFSDKSGEYQIYTQSIDGGNWTQITTSLDRMCYHLEWSPDGKKILFGNKDFSIFYVDIATKKLTKVDTWNQMKNDEFYWEVSDYGWSPDSKWICYSKVAYNKNNTVWIYSLEQDNKYAVTSDFYDNLYPAFDAAGKYLYFVSSRNFDIQMDFYEDNHVYHTPQQIMAVSLQKNSAPPFADPAGSEEIKIANPNYIDTDGIEKRVYALPIEPGNYFFLRTGKNKVMWCAVDKFTEDEYEEIFKPKGAAKWNLHIFDMNDKKEVTLTDKISDFRLSANQEQLIIKRDKELFCGTVEQAFKSKSSGAKLTLANLTYTVEYKKEWEQIFNDTWRWYRDFFFDVNMHGQNWKMLGERYKAYLPSVYSRSMLNYILSQMVGELCVSHTYISGGDNGVITPPTNPVFTGWLGADLQADSKTGLFKFTRIYGPTGYNPEVKAPLARPDIDLHEGDYLIAINGNEIKSPDDYNRYLQVTAGKKISLTVNSEPSAKNAKTYSIEPIRNSSKLRYVRWVSDNIAKVEKLSNGKLGYLHVTAMGGEGIGQFDKFWRAFRYRDGIVIDMRRNSGDWTEYFMIDKLERKMTAKNTLRGMEPFRYPGSTSTGNYVAISNEYNGSDGEAFIEDFKANKLGKVVGVPSWGGLVGILNGQKTLDNGTVEQPNNGFYDASGKWLVENHGADPDILVDNDPASVMSGKDAQLEKAIEVLLKQVDDKPFNFPAPPPIPKK